MQRVRLSTSMTFFWKFVFSTIWIGGFGIGAFIAIWELGIDGLPFLIGLTFGITLIYYGCIRSKNVHMDDDFLYLNNFRKTVKVPFSEISRVSDNIFFTPRPIFIEFKHETEFGKKIMFIGYTEMFLFFSTHPAVNKLRSRIKNV